jgi:hypothetical protein
MDTLVRADDLHIGPRPPRLRYPNRSTQNRSITDGNRVHSERVQDERRTDTAEILNERMAAAEAKRQRKMAKRAREASKGND